MKAIRLLSIILMLALLSCCFIGCGEDEVDANIPETELYEAKVSFEIKDSTGRRLFEAIDYEYKWIKEPTILNIIQQYVLVERGAAFIVDGDTVTRIGGVKVNSKKEYCAFMKGINIDVTEILADKNGQNKFINGKISTYNVVDEGLTEFTVVIAPF